MPLSDRVRVARAFQRAVRIDSDISKPSALEGFICPPSSAVALRTMARHVAETGQAAFTWTGPYGAGKSSLAVALAAALDGNAQVRERAERALGKDTTAFIREALPPKSKGWRVLPVVGRRGRPAQAIGVAIVQNKLKRGRQNGEWSDEKALDALAHIARRDSDKRGGLLVIIDEMGKFLEGAAYNGADIYFFQQLAELASRSDNRLIVVGALHQAFEEYSNRLSREIRDEWAKIQGRYVDVAIDASSEEQLVLLSRAIEFAAPERDISELATEVVDIAGGRFQVKLLEECWPLHPIVACLLGPISRRRFGQNQRSLFGFLTSAEPEGFQDFLANADCAQLYSPTRLLDYLRLNMETSIMASSDGHRWGMAVDAIERCRTKGGGDLHIRLLQTIALLELFKERSGIAASEPALCLALKDDFTSRKVKAALSDLRKWSMVIYREFSGAYGVYEGSDFDIDAALDTAYANFTLDAQMLGQHSELKPIFAKRHYHQFGALRWYDVILSLFSDIDATVRACISGERLSEGSAGAFVLTIRTDESALGQNGMDAVGAALNMAQDARVDIAIGTPNRFDRLLPSLMRELQALKWISENTPELRGDGVARAEVRSRIASAEERIASELERALDNAVWHFGDGSKRKLGLAKLSAAASDAADKRFSKSPRISNELLNRIRPSSNGATGRNILLRRMIADEGKERLGIAGYPIEGGLFDSLLGETGLYRKIGGMWSFGIPQNACKNFSHIWNAAEELLKRNSDKAVSMQAIYEIWRQAPYGVKDGVMPVIAAAFLLSHKSSLAFYRDGVFQPALAEIDADILSRTPQHISVRWMGEYRVDQAKFWRSMTTATRQIASNALDENAEPLEVARTLVAAYDGLPKWTERTALISENAKRVRRILKDAHDPNKVIFNELASIAERNEDAPARLRSGMLELRASYPKMLKRLRDTMLSELGAAADSDRAFSALQARADNIRGISGDHRMESFTMRIAEFDGSDAATEALASLSINKPPREWSDADVDRAAIELAHLSREFIDLETLAHISGRADGQRSIAIAVGLNGAPVYERFKVPEQRRAEIDALVKDLEERLQSRSGLDKGVALAALAEMSARYINAKPKPEA